MLCNIKYEGALINRRPRHITVWDNGGVDPQIVIFNTTWNGGVSMMFWQFPPPGEKSPVATKGRGGGSVEDEN